MIDPNTDGPDPILVARTDRGRRLSEAFNRQPQPAAIVDKAQEIWVTFERLGDTMYGRGLYPEGLSDTEIIRNALIVIRDAPEPINDADAKVWLKTVTQTELEALCILDGGKRFVSRELLERNRDWRMTMYRRAIRGINPGAGVVNVRRDLGEVNRNERERELTQ